MTKTQTTTETEALTPRCKARNDTPPRSRGRTQADGGSKVQDRAAVDGERVVNDVRLVGRLSSEPAVVELPSGDVLVTFRISVPRSSTSARSRTPAATGRRVDSVPCTAWSPRLRRSIMTWRAGDLVEISGAVRCRFYQAGGATRSRVEVEVVAGKIMRRSSAA